MDKKTATKFKVQATLFMLLSPDALEIAIPNSMEIDVEEGNSVAAIEQAKKHILDIKEIKENLESVTRLWLIAISTENAADYTSYDIQFLTDGKLEIDVDSNPQIGLAETSNITDNFYEIAELECVGECKFCHKKDTEFC